MFLVPAARCHQSGSIAVCSGNGLSLSSLSGAAALAGRRQITGGDTQNPYFVRVRARGWKAGTPLRVERRTLTLTLLYAQCSHDSYSRTQTQKRHSKSHFCLFFTPNNQKIPFSLFLTVWWYGNWGIQASTLGRHLNKLHKSLFWAPENVARNFLLKGSKNDQVNLGINKH